MATKLPESSSSGLTTQDVRLFMLDNQVENNLLDLDLTWSEEEILNAMRRTAMMFNEIEPISGSLNINPFRLPTSYAILAGVAYQLYLSTIQKYQRNDLEYSVGGVKANLFSKRIGHFTQMMQFLKEEFEIKVGNIKTSANLNNAWGTIG